ncbi:ABC transporter permease [Methanogenium cariaci]|uniref:ABC transporter permease n=1 Tax=Methanogenium cariaci TaxID=2197 RepID=UPI000A548A86|nr:FtsX-like permease family protein [Methanogenium cariaci]
MDAVIIILSFFTGISLFVGALMIINTMVVSVYERTREIGITMALGASHRHVLASSSSNASTSAYSGASQVICWASFSRWVSTPSASHSFSNNWAPPVLPDSPVPISRW